MDFINWDLLKNPLNWIIVVLMLAIGTFALTLILPSAKALNLTQAV